MNTSDCFFFLFSFLKSYLEKKIKDKKKGEQPFCGRRDHKIILCLLLYVWEGSYGVRCMHKCCVAVCCRCFQSPAEFLAVWRDVLAVGLAYGISLLFWLFERVQLSMLLTKSSFRHHQIHTVVYRFFQAWMLVCFCMHRSNVLILALSWGWTTCSNTKEPIWLGF